MTITTVIFLYREIFKYKINITFMNKNYGGAITFREQEDFE